MGQYDRNTGYSEIKMRNLRKLGYDVKEIVANTVLNERNPMKKIIEIRR